MAVRRVVGDDIGHQLDAGGMQCCCHLIEIFKRPQFWVHIAVIIDVVSTVRKRRRVERAQPNGVDPQFLQVRNLGSDALEVTDAVAIGIGEAAGVDLVHSCLAPPVRISHSLCIGTVCLSGGSAHETPLI